MSRSKPQILAENANGAYRADQVLASEGIWAVYYQNQPINLKTVNLLVSYPGPKYRKTAFANPGHAVNLARKLNAQFKTTAFSVVLLSVGQQIFP